MDAGKVEVEVVGFDHNWHCREAVGLGCLVGEGESFALRCSSRWLP